MNTPLFAGAIVLLAIGTGNKTVQLVAGVVLLILNFVKF